MSLPIPTLKPPELFSTRDCLSNSSRFRPAGTSSHLYVQLISVIMGAYFPIICIILCETRATVILRRKAHKFRHTLTGFPARFTAKSEIEKVKFSVALQQSLLRPISECPLVLNTPSEGPAGCFL